MDEFQELLVDELQNTDGIFEASVLVSEVRFILKNTAPMHVRCRIWYDLEQREYRYDLSHERPGMIASNTVWAGSPRAALQIALERLTHGYGASTEREFELVKNPFFDDPNAEDAEG